MKRSDLSKIPIVGPSIAELAARILTVWRRKIYRGSEDFWKERYRNGGHSGYGSYGDLAKFKADVLNRFVREESIQSVIEFGCGDGNQLSMADYPSYTGVDISVDAVRICREKFLQDGTKSFCTLSQYSGEKADLSLSLDVIFHLVEDGIFQTHINTLFSSAKKYVIIYSSNTNENSTNPFPQVRHRKFSDHISAAFPYWDLFSHIPNKYPYTSNTTKGSFSDFYFYKLNARNDV